MRQIRLPLAGVLLALAWTSEGHAADLFRDEVAAIFETQCVRCHNAKEPKGGLALDRVAAAAKGGESGPAWVAGKPDDSLLLEYVTGAKPEMPKGAPPLSKAQAATLRRWIADGAQWPADLALTEKKPDRRAWWSFQPLVRPAIPAANGATPERTPIDAFITAKLREHGLAMSPEADRRTLIRRLTFDLHGLPPTPEEIVAFVGDSSPKAYEALVDRLLESPRYGERWARHWLDVVHYGDTHGYDKDKRRPSAWPYRDYVIRSLNADKPYTRFVQEQIAGDVLFAGEPDGVIATGFIAAGPWDFVGHVELREGTTDKLITRLLDRDDMLSNTMSTFTSLTVHCSRCHDHPFDPITQDDYYSLQAVFAGLDRGDRAYKDEASEKHRQSLIARQAEIHGKQAALNARLAGLKSPDLERLDGEIRGLTQRQSKLTSFIPPADGPITSPTNGYHSNIEGRREAAKWVQVDLGRSLPIDAVYLVPARPIDFRDAPGFGFPQRFKVEVSEEPEFRKPDALADYTGADYANPGDQVVTVRSEATAVPTARYVRVTATRLWERSHDWIFALGELTVVSQGAVVSRGAKVTSLDSIEQGRWSMRHLVDGFNSRHPLPDFARPELAASAAERAEIDKALASSRESRAKAAEALVDESSRHERTALAAQLAAVDNELKIVTSGPKVYAVLPIPPRPIHWLTRGDVKTPGKEMGPGTVATLTGLGGPFQLEKPQQEGERRAALARWLTDPANVLAWRSIVNRVWHFHFGQGLVDSPNDFGHMGSLPSHPELLDWLAVEFRDGGGSLKQLHRLIVTSAAYRQTSASEGPQAASAAKIDSGNKLLWRMNRRRLDAESIRDAVLATSGKLSLTMGGPGFDAFGFKDDHSPHYLYDQHNVDDPRSFRRTIYRTIVRSVPDPFLECMDCPDPSLLAPVRNETITALQALALANNAFMVKQAEHFAARVQQEAVAQDAGKNDVRRQAALAFERALGRKPTATEEKALAGYAEKHGLASACRVLFNANEFVFVD